MQPWFHRCIEHAEIDLASIPVRCTECELSPTICSSWNKWFLWICWKTLQSWCETTFTLSCSMHLWCAILGKLSFSCNQPHYDSKIQAIWLVNTTTWCRAAIFLQRGSKFLHAEYYRKLTKESYRLVVGGDFQACVTEEGAGDDIAFAYCCWLHAIIAS